MFSRSKLIIAAGMPRSGSTWLYNAARLLISSIPSMSKDFSFGWVGDIDNIPKTKFMLVKMHDYDSRLVEASSCVLYSYRDIRDAVASSYRKFRRTPTIEVADQFIAQYGKWENVAHYVMRYESMLTDKENIIEDLKNILLLEKNEIDNTEIVRTIETLNYQNSGNKNEIYHTTNLYHRDHITDGRHGSWKDTLDISLVKEIEKKYKSWLIKNQYPLNYH